MPDQIGNINVPEITASGTFPIVTEFAHPVVREYRDVIHTFPAGNRKREQRFRLGLGARRFTVYRPNLNATDLAALRDFWEARQGAYQPFTYNAPNADQTTSAVTCRFENGPLGWQVLGPMIMSGQCTLVEVISSNPSYTLSATVTRFPSAPLASGLLSQQQIIIPLIKIQCKESGYPAIYLSDRRCTINGQLYQARLLQWDGISQSLGSASDDASFTFGNADNVMSLLAADTDLFRASIEFSLFVVAGDLTGGAGTKVDLWKGEIADWEDPESPAEFRVRASDGYELGLPYPFRKITRTCGNAFDDGNACPYTSSGSLNGSYPSASALSCDRGYRTPNGCEAHNMIRFFTGVIAEPQGVSIKDNSTGVWGFRRNTLNSTSIVNDSVYDQVVPEVYTDSDFPVPAKVLAARDESDFFEGVGLVCEGPVTFGSGHQIDRQFHHGYPGALGLRTIPGNTPAGVADFLSLDQSGNQVNGDPTKVFSGGSTYKNNFSAGIAAIVIRRGDEKGLQLSLPSEHEMKAVVAAGLQGWVWSAAGSRTTATLTNPVWIVVNMMLRARGLRFANAATAEQYFDVDAAIAAAAICDLTVNKIAGLSGTETQFKCRGLVQEEKPLRDWIDDVLLNCAGYWSQSFGKLRIGIRVNSSVVEAFTTGNVIAGSVNTFPIRAEFNDLTAVFADELYEYAGNSVSIFDDDHQRLIGGGTAAPKKIKKQFNLPFTTNASQAARWAQMRLKEELGGATLAERKLARRIAFRTTILALAVEPGMVCSLTHEKMPGGAGEFRVRGWRLNQDYSIDIEGQTTTDSMYDATAGPKPADVLPAAIPPEDISYPRRPAWQPAGTHPGTDQIISTHRYFFQIGEDYEHLEGGGVRGLVLIRGFAGRNKFLDVPPPVIRGISYSTASGTLDSGNYYFVQVVPYQGVDIGPPSNVLAIEFPLSSPGRIDIASVTWPAAPSGSWDGYRIYAGHTEASICECVQVVGSTLPSSVSFTGPMKYGWYGVNPNLRKIRGKAKLVYAPGVVWAKITDRTSSTIVCDAFAGGGDAFAGRIVMVDSDLDNGIPPINTFGTALYDQATGTFTVDRNPVSAGVQIGDVLVVLAGGNIASSTTYGDSVWNFATDELAGYNLRILFGPGAGQVRKIRSNTATTCTVEPAWTVTPNSNSNAIVEYPDWQWSAETSDADNVSGARADFSIPIDNQHGVHVLAVGIGVDRWGQEASEEQSPVRMMFFYGEQFTRDVSANDSQLPDDRAIVVDTTAGDVDLQLLAAADARGRLVVKNKGANVVNLLPASGETTEATSVAANGSVVIFPKAEDAAWYTEAGGSGGGGGGGAGNYYLLVTLANNTTQVSRTVEAAGSKLVVRVKQDGTGGWTLQPSNEWSADFAMNDTFVPTDPNTWVDYGFFSDGSKWHQEFMRVNE